MQYRIQQLREDEWKPLREAFSRMRSGNDTQEADFGMEQAEFCFAAQESGKTLGACWVWNLQTDEEPAEIYVFVEPGSRSIGIGTDLVRTMTDYLALCGYPEIFAVVRRDNYAVLLFGSVGFKPVKEVDLVYTLRLDLTAVGQIQMQP